MEILGKILNSTSRVKIMRLFLQGRGKVFSNKDIVKRSRVNPSIARKEIKLLSSTGFIKKHSTGWSLNTAFQFLRQFEELLVKSGEINRKTIIDNFKKTGKIKLIIISGLFIKEKDARVDLLIVGDKLKQGKVEESIKKLEAEMGTELAFVVLETKEFVYRLEMYDKLVRDVLDFPHEVVFASKELSTYTLKKS